MGDMESKFHEAYRNMVLSYDEEIRLLKQALIGKDIYAQSLAKKYKDLQKKKEINEPDMALFVELANTKEKLQETEAMLYMATRYPEEIEKIRGMMKV
jgi:hypothetical protein